MERNGQVFTKGRGRGRRFGRSLATFGSGLEKFGAWLAKIGHSWEPLGERIETLGDLDVASLPTEAGAKPLGEPAPVPPTIRPEPDGLRKPASLEATTDLTEVQAREGKPPHWSRKQGPVRPTVATTAESCELPTDVRAAIASLGRRPRSERLRDVIESICRIRAWTTVRELSAFLGVSEKTLRSRHLPAMIKETRLIRRHPDRPRHRRQAYAVPRPRSQAPERLHPISGARRT